MAEKAAFIIKAMISRFRGLIIKTRKGIRAISSQNDLLTAVLTIQISLLILYFSTIYIAGIWISCPRGGMAARIPIIRLEAPSFSAKATRNIPPVNVAIAVSYTHLTLP